MIILEKDIPRRLKRRQGRTSNDESKKASAEGDSSQGFLRYKKASDEEYNSLPDNFFDSIVNADIDKDSSQIASEKLKDFKERHGRMPQQSELDEIAEEVFVQIKEDYEKKMKEEREKLQKEAALKREKRKVSLVLESEKREAERLKRIQERAGSEEVMPAEEEPLTYEGEPEAEEELQEQKDEEKTLSLEDLEAQQIKELSEKAEEGSEEEMPEEDIETISAEMETDKNKCPNCMNKTDKVIFCPNCGSGFCPHCAAKVEVIGNAVKYTCPVCKYSFKSSKSQ